MGHEFVSSADDDLVVIYATFYRQDCVLDLETIRRIHLLLKLIEMSLTNFINNKLSAHAVWIVRVLPWNAGLKIINVLVCLLEELGETINFVVRRKYLDEVIALFKCVCFVWLTFCLAGDIKVVFGGGFWFALFVKQVWVLLVCVFCIRYPVCSYITLTWWCSVCTIISK